MGKQWWGKWLWGWTELGQILRFFSSQSSMFCDLAGMASWSSCFSISACGKWTFYRENVIWKLINYDIEGLVINYDIKGSALEKEAILVLRVKCKCCFHPAWEHPVAYSKHLCEAACTLNLPAQLPGKNWGLGRRKNERKQTSADLILPKTRVQIPNQFWGSGNCFLVLM